MFARFAEACEAIAATTKKSEKVALLAAYFKELQPEEGRLAAVFASGRCFPLAEERKLGVGGAMLWQVLAGITGADPQTLVETYRKHGDTGALAGELLAARESHGQTLAEVAARLAELAAARGSTQKHPLLAMLLGNSSGLESKYLVKIITGDMRIGLQESLVEEAIAKRFGVPLDLVKRANLFTGDIGETLVMAAEGRLAETRLRLFHPIGFMLASPVLDWSEALEPGQPVLVEDKYDGIRAHLHKEGGRMTLFSRTLDQITHQFPELEPAALAVPGAFLLDGEILAWRDGRALPFAALQKRLGRKSPGAELLEAVPVIFMAFDLLYLDGEALFEMPLVERRRRLATLLRDAPPGMLLSQERPVADLDALHREFDAAQARGNEGLMVKQTGSPYTAGSRGMAWIKIKKEMATLDVVVTAVEYGHGKRRAVLSDYTFAVRGPGGELLEIGKAFTGLTDKEIEEMTRYFLEHTLEDQGFRRRVEPLVVLEVAFNNIQKSARHPSGYALRFPRIKRIRTDKSPGEIDTLETVRELYLKQLQ